MPQNSSLFNGGIIGKDNTPSASDKVTTITSNGCFNRTTATATVIVVAGGGSGGQGGGGAGGVLITECHPLPASSVPVTIGAGGAARASSAPYANPGTSGSNSVFGSSTPLTARGGAGGGGWDRYNTKGERIGKCGDRKPGEGKPKCLSKSRAASLRAKGGKEAIARAVNRKRRKDPDKNRRGKAKNVKN